MKILAFAASKREGSFNQALLNIALDVVHEQDADCDIHHLTYDRLDVPLYDPALHADGVMPKNIDAVHNLFDEADAFIIASPEYNWSYPGTLKNLIDWLSCYRPNALHAKPVFIMCATPSEAGGAMCIHNLKSLLGGWLGMYPYPRTFGLGQASAMLQDGVMMDDGKKQQLEMALSGFLGYCRKLV